MRPANAPADDEVRPAPDAKTELFPVDGRFRREASALSAEAALVPSATAGPALLDAAFATAGCHASSERVLSALESVVATLGGTVEARLRSDELGMRDLESSPARLAGC